MTNLLVSLIIVIVVAGIVQVFRRLSQRANEMRELCEHGRAVVGKVSELRKERRSKADQNHFLGYTFSSPAGLKFLREYPVSEFDFAKYVEGQDIEIVYLPNDPDVSALKTYVDQTRDAMNRSQA